ncbi:MAG: GNAT family N-acetyltransferase [Candidatus ainarchaeum sp.]|nr:GNAT family N-acetyltransferase [Candidatus ainarchaeum sp.]
MVREFRLKTGVTVTLRKFEPRDAASCSTLLNKSFKVPSPLPEIATQLYERELAAYRFGNIQKTAHKRNYEVAEVAGQVAGLVGIRRFPAAAGIVKEVKLFKLSAEHITVHKPPAAEVLDLVVAEEFRCRKIGSLLTLAALIDKIDEGVKYFHAYAPANATRVLAYGGFAKVNDVMGSIRWGKVASFYASLTKESKPLLFEAIEALLQPPGSHLKAHHS